MNALKQMHFFILTWTCLTPLSDLFNSVVEFKDEEFVKKAIETMNKHDLSGRPLNIKEVGTIQLCIVMLGPGFSFVSRNLSFYPFFSLF